MAANYDFYITCLDDPEWEKRILKKLQNKGFKGYHKEKFPLGGMKLRSRYNAVQSHRVKIIGFVSPLVKKTDMDSYIAALALESGKVDDDRIICVKVTKDAVIPEEFSGLVTVEGWDEEELCEGIVECIKSVKRGGSIRDSMDTRNNVNSSTFNSVATSGMREQNQQMLGGQDEIDVAHAAGANREAVLEADTGVGGAGRKWPLMYWLIVCGLVVISIITFTLLSIYPERKIPLIYALIACGIFVILIVTYILLNVYPYINYFSMQKKVICALFICLIVSFFIGVLYNFVYFESLSDTQKRSSIFAYFVIIIVMLIALYDFNATLSQLESLTDIKKVAISCIIIIFLLIFFQVVSNIELILKPLFDILFMLWTK